MSVDLERAISTWRRSFDGLRDEDIDELESHVRDELDALAEVGMTGPDALVHATTKFGPSSELVDEMERAAPSMAWRGPAIALLTGFLVNVLGSAILSVVDWSVLLFGMAVKPGVGWVYLALVMVVIVAPVVTLGGGFGLASRCVARVERMPVWSRIAIVVGMGFFVLAASVPIGALPLSSEFIGGWAAWRVFTGPARRLIAFALPIVFLGVFFLARRRNARGVAWAVLGYLAKTFGATLWVFSATCAARIACLIDPRDVSLIERWATMASIVLPTAALMLAVSLHTRVTPTKFVRSRFAPLAAIGLAGGGLLMRFADNHLLCDWPGFGAAGYEAMSYSYLGISILASLCLTPLAAAGLLRLRSA